MNRRCHVAQTALSAVSQIANLRPRRLAVGETAGWQPVVFGILLAERRPRASESGGQLSSMWVGVCLEVKRAAFGQCSALKLIDPGWPL